LNGFFGAVSAIRVAAWKLEARRGDRRAVLTAMPWRLILLWIASMTLFLVSAVLVVRQRPEAPVVFFAALAVDLTVFWTAQRSAVGATPAARGRLTRYLLFGLLFTAGLGARAANSHPTTAPEGRAAMSSRHGDFS
jgi:hypothetical protein